MSIERGVLTKKIIVRELEGCPKAQSGRPLRVCGRGCWHGAGWSNRRYGAKTGGVLHVTCSAPPGLHNTINQAMNQATMPAATMPAESCGWHIGNELNVLVGEGNGQEDVEVRS